MGKPRLPDDPWPLLERLASAGINPATLEAYVTPRTSSLEPDYAFFQAAMLACETAWKALGASFEALSMERKIAALDIILAVGAGQISPGLLKAANKPNEGRAIEAVGIIAKPMEKSRRQRALDSLKGDRLVFAAPPSQSEPAINDVRDGKVQLGLGHQGQAVRYLQRLLQVAQRILASPPLPKDTFGLFTPKTTDALRAFQRSVFPSQPEQIVTGVPDRYTVALLELIVLTTKPRSAPKKEEEPTLLFVEDEELPIQITFKDFDTFFDFYTKVQLAGSAVGSKSAVTPGDLQNLKYLLGFVEQANKEKIEELEKAFDEALDSSKKFLCDLWRSGFLGKTAEVSAVAAAGLLLYFSAKRAATDQATFFDKRLLDGAGALLHLVKFKIEPEKDGGLYDQPGGWTLEGGLKGAPGDFKDSSGKGVEGPGGAGEISLSYTRYKPLPSDADLASLKNGGFDDSRVWYSEATNWCYRTYDLRTLVARGKIGRETNVIEITSQKHELKKISGVPALSGVSLYSSRDEDVRYAAKLSLNGAYIWDPKDKSGLFQFGGGLKGTVRGFSWGVSANFQKLSMQNPLDHQAHVEGFLRDLEASFGYKLPLGVNNNSNTNSLDFSLGVKGSQTSFTPFPQLNSNSLVTQGGITWNVVREGSHRFKLSLTSTYPLQQENTSTRLYPKAQLRLESGGKKFNLTLDLDFPVQPNPVDRSIVKVGFLYRF